MSTKLIIITQISNFINDLNCNPGIILKIDDNYILIGTGKGTLKILKVSYQNKYKLNEIFSEAAYFIKKISFCRSNI